MAAARLSLVWSPEAERDLLEIWNYLAVEATLDLADARLRAIDGACRLIADHPHSGRAREELAPRLRSIAASPQIIFYRITEDAIQIVRVLDGRRDIEEIFSE